MTEEMKNVTPETAEAPEHVETMEDYKEELEASFKQIHEGDILTGTVIGVSESAITLDLKYYTDGIIRLEDFTNDPNFNLAEDIHHCDPQRRRRGPHPSLRKRSQRSSGLGQAPQIQRRRHKSQS